MSQGGWPSEQFVSGVANAAIVVVPGGEPGDLRLGLGPGAQPVETLNRPVLEVGASTRVRLGASFFDSCHL